MVYSQVAMHVGKLLVGKEKKSTHTQFIQTKTYYHQECWENFHLQSQLCVLTLIRCLFHSRVTAVARKRPWSCHSAKSAGGRLLLKTHTPLTHQSQSGLTMPLSRQSVGICQETSSHTTRHGTLGHSCLLYTSPSPRDDY